MWAEGASRRARASRHLARLTAQEQRAPGAMSDSSPAPRISGRFRCFFPANQVDLSGREDLREPLFRASFHGRFEENPGELADRRNTVQREGTAGDGAGGNWEATKNGLLPPRIGPCALQCARWAAPS